LVVAFERRIAKLSLLLDNLAKVNIFLQDKWSEQIGAKNGDTPLYDATETDAVDLSKFKDPTQAESATPKRASSQAASGDAGKSGGGGAAAAVPAAAPAAAVTLKSPLAAASGNAQSGAGASASSLAASSTSSSASATVSSNATATSPDASGKAGMGAGGGGSENDDELRVLRYSLRRKERRIAQLEVRLQARL
jgi:hypothetical protein